MTLIFLTWIAAQTCVGVCTCVRWMRGWMLALKKLYSFRDKQKKERFFSSPCTVCARACACFRCFQEQIRMFGSSCSWEVQVDSEEDRSHGEMQLEHCSRWKNRQCLQSNGLVAGRSQHDWQLRTGMTKPCSRMSLDCREDKRGNGRRRGRGRRRRSRERGGTWKQVDAVDRLICRGKCHFLNSGGARRIEEHVWREPVSWDFFHHSCKLTPGTHPQRLNVSILASVHWPDESIRNINTIAPNTWV